MFSICISTPGFFVLSPYAADFANESGLGRRLTGVAYGPFKYGSGDPATSTLLVGDGTISSSVKDAMGERSCSHNNCVGRLLIPTFQVTDEAKRLGYVGHVYNAPGMPSFGDLTSPDAPTIRETIGPNYIMSEYSCIEGRYAIIGNVRGFIYKRTHRTSMVLYMYNFNQDFSQYTVDTISVYEKLVSSEAFTQSEINRMRNLRPAKTLSNSWKPITRYPTTQVEKPVINQQDLNRVLRIVKDPNLYDPLLALRPKDVWGDLAQSCADSLAYCPVNAIAFLRELRDWRKLIPKVKHVTTPKTWAEWYLSYRYGIPLTIKDFRSYVRSFKNSIDSSLHSMNEVPRVLYARYADSSSLSKYVVTNEYHYKVIADRYPSALMNLIREMKEWGLYPTLENAWDLIPYSFVVDWFYQVDHLFKALDDRIFWQYYNVLTVVRSEKHSFLLPGTDLIPNLNVLGDIRVVNYQRKRKKNMDMPRIKLDSPSEFHNYVEFAALIVQRKK